MRSHRRSAYAFLSMVTLFCADNAIESSSVSDSEPEAFKSLLEGFSDVYGDSPLGLPTVRGGVSHNIPLVHGAEPPFKPIYRLSKPERLAVQEDLTALSDKGFVEPSTSPFGSPILFVHEKDGSLRMVIDYRAVNQITVKDRYH